MIHQFLISEILILKAKEIKNSLISSNTNYPKISKFSFEINKICLINLFFLLWLFLELLINKFMFILLFYHKLLYLFIKLIFYSTINLFFILSFINIRILFYKIYKFFK